MDWVSKRCVTTAPVVFTSLLALWLFYRVSIAIYNISPLHPLAHFPGPKLAAASYLYEAYYDWWRVGIYGRKIRQMHKKYGPIVRINPDELHCDDPYFADEIYAVGGRIRDKFQHQLNQAAFGPLGTSTFATAPHELHRARRGAIARSFSRAQVLKLESEVLDVAQRTVAKILRCTGAPFDIREAFNCFTADVIACHAFGESMGFVDQEGWEPNFASWTKAFLNVAYMLRHNAWLRRLCDLAMPLARYMGSDVSAVMEQLNVVIPGYVEAAIKDPDHGRVFAEVMESKLLPPEEKTLHRLSGEGFVFLLAGTETTSASLSVILYHLLARPEIRARLIEELRDVDTTKLKWTELEQHPYLFAVIHESLRMIPGVSERGARIARTENLLYRSQDGKIEWVVPMGTPISMTSIITHYNEEIFPKPHEFRPERWLLPDGQPDHKLQKFLMAFGRGSRACAGEHLAYSEMYIMTTLLALKVVLRAQLFETTIDNVTYDHDLLTVMTKKGPIAVHVTISADN